MQVRIEPELKTEAEDILLQLGLSPTEYIRMSLRQLVMQRGLPFDARLPNSTTRAALDEDLADAPRYRSARSLLNDISGDS